MELDEKFGPCAMAGRPIEPHELEIMPKSRMEVTAETAPILTEYLSETPRLKLTSIFSQTFHVLWLMDKDARIFVAIEELIDDKGLSIGALPSSVSAQPAQFRKLGHPSLLDSDPRMARIGGEIVYDPEWHANTYWVLTNKSGRYGLRQWQTEDHLREVGRLLETHGLYLGHRFIKPLV